MEDKTSKLKRFENHISDFMIIYAVILGIVMGMGFLFLGILKNKASIILFAGIALLMGMLSIPTLVNEQDEYNLKNYTPRQPRPIRSNQI